MRWLTMCLFCVLAGSAGAATVTTREFTVTGERGEPSPRRVVELTAADGETNRVGVDVGRDGVRVTDTATPLTPGGLCRAEGPGVFCPLGYGTASGPAVVAKLGDGDDELLAGPPEYGYVTVEGGPGADVLRAGGMLGGPGPDTFHGVASYSDHDGPVTVTLDGLANDGALGEGDNVLGNGAFGTRFADVLVGGPGDDALWGAGGVGDRIAGGGGDDRLDAHGGGADLDGGDGDDRLSAFPPPGSPGSVLRGGVGDDVLTTHFGDDTLDGGPGRDDLRSGAGADTVRAGDDAIDRVDCGDDVDRVVVDRDEWAAQCERIERRGTPRAVLEDATLASYDPRRWLVLVGCPADHGHACAITLRVRGRTIGRLRVRPGDRKQLVGRLGRRVRVGDRVVLTARDARGRPVRATRRIAR